MIAAISTAEDRARLAAICRGWIGTPYCGDGAVKGSGVSCSLLPWSILNEYGHSVARPPARANMPKKSVFSFMRDWLNSAEGFAPVALADLQPGDVALIEYGMGHLGLAMDANDFIHCWRGYGVHLTNRKSPKIAQRIRGVWRPII